LYTVICTHRHTHTRDQLLQMTAGLGVIFVFSASTASLFVLLEYFCVHFYIFCVFLSILSWLSFPRNTCLLDVEWDGMLKPLTRCYLLTITHCLCFCSVTLDEDDGYLRRQGGRYVIVLCLSVIQK